MLVSNLSIVGRGWHGLLLDPYEWTILVTLVTIVTIVVIVVLTIL